MVVTSPASVAEHSGLRRSPARAFRCRITIVSASAVAPFIAPHILGDLGYALHEYRWPCDGHGNVRMTVE
jgi:hypothetical protein